MKPTSRAIAALVLSLAVLPACGSSAGGSSAVGSLDVPAFPYAERAGLRVDAEHLDAGATRHCRARRGDASAVRLLLEDLPFDAVDSFCVEPRVCPGCAEGMGELYLSGYFGGIWLADALDDDGGGATARASAARLVTLPPGGFDAVTFDALAGSAERILALVRDGDDAAVLAEARSGVPFLLALFGYNRGYLERALESPPPGQAPLDPLQCDGLIDCTREGRQLDALARHRGAVAKLEAPPTPRWGELAALVDGLGASTVASGREVWDGILSDSSIAAEAYEPLAEVSAGYLLVSEAALLASMEGWAEGDVDTARCGLVVRAGLTLWSGSYFMGLAASAPAGTFPTLTCTDG